MTISAASVNVSINDSRGERLPGLLTPDVVNKLGGTRGQHVINDNIRFGRKPSKDPSAR